MSLKKAYYYFFYKMYVYNEMYGHRVRRGENYALFVVVGAEIFIMFSFVNYYAAFSEHLLQMRHDRLYFCICLALLSAINYVIFLYKSRWKKYNDEFDKLPDSTNRNGTKIVWVVIIAIVANLAFSHYLRGTY